MRWQTGVPANWGPESRLHNSIQAADRPSCQTCEPFPACGRPPKDHARRVVWGCSIAHRSLSVFEMSSVDSSAVPNNLSVGGFQSSLTGTVQGKRTRIAFAIPRNSPESHRSFYDYTLAKTFLLTINYISHLLAVTPVNAGGGYRDGLPCILAQCARREPHAPCTVVRGFR